VLVSWKARPRPLVMMVQVVIGVVCVCELSLRGVLGFWDKGLWKKVEKLKGGVSRGPEVQRKNVRRPEVRVFFSGFLGRMVRGAGGEVVRMVG